MNHSARKTMIQILCSANVPDSKITQLSGHKSYTSHNHYKKPSLDEQRLMLNLLSPNCSMSVSKQETNLHSNQLCSTPGLLSNATFNRCTVNIHVNTPSSQLFMATSQAPTNTSKCPKLDL